MFSSRAGRLTAVSFLVFKQAFITFKAFAGSGEVGARDLSKAFNTVSEVEFT
jgi:hypothetical protein